MCRFVHMSKSRMDFLILRRVWHCIFFYKVAPWSLYIGFGKLVDYIMLKSSISLSYSKFGRELFGAEIEEF